MWLKFTILNINCFYLGIIPKIEADYSEPVVKRLNFHSREDSINNTMSMVADKVELENRFGKKDNTVKDRLGKLVFLKFIV